jgi:hypothetical protein
VVYTGCFKKSFTTLKAYINVFWGHVQCLNCHNEATHRVLSAIVIAQCDFMQGVSKRALQWYSNCYCVASITKIFTPKGVQTIHLSSCWTMGNLYDFKCKPFINTRHTVTIGIPLQRLFWNTLYITHSALRVQQSRSLGFSLSSLKGQFPHPGGWNRKQVAV